MATPFDQTRVPTGPQITPKTGTAAAQGGMAMPPYLQMRSPMVGATAPQPMQPVVTPKPTVQGDTINAVKQKPEMPDGQPNTPGGGGMPGGMPGMPMQPGKPMINPRAPGPGGPTLPAQGGQPGAQPPQAGGSDLTSVYNFLKSDLENQRNQALSTTKSDAAARGVYYGTPLTGSEADINTQYLRGLGQLGAGMYGNQQQNDLARLGLATNLMWQSGMNAPTMPGAMDFSGLGALFGSSPQQPGGVNTARSGPVMTPNNNPNVNRNSANPMRPL